MIKSFIFASDTNKITMNEIIKINTIEAYNEVFGLETAHPLVGIVDLSKATKRPSSVKMNFGVYALFLKGLKCGEIRYGRQIYDYQEGTVTSFAPGQVVEVNIDPQAELTGKGLLFHPDVIKGTPIGRDIRNYTFFSYSSSEALHLSDEEKMIFTDCLNKIAIELDRPIDKFSKRLIAMNIELLLNYCMRFYSRQFITRSVANKSILNKFESLLDDYYSDKIQEKEGLPSVKYFAGKVCLSANYFGDLIKKETGKTAQEYIQNKRIDMAKEMLLGTEKTVSQIADELGFQYSQHFNRIFKKNTGYTPKDYRKLSA